MEKYSLGLRDFVCQNQSNFIDFLKLILTTYKPGYSIPTGKYEARSFSYGPSLRGLRISSTDRLTRLVNRLLFNDIIIFQTETISLQDLHIVWYMLLMFTPRLSGI